MNKTVLRTAVVMTAVFLFLFTAAIPVNALTFNGSSSGGSAGTAIHSSGNYGCAGFVDDEYVNAPAYRFTIVNSSGDAVVTPADIYRSVYKQYMGASYHKFDNKLPKTDLKNKYSYSTYTTSAATANCMVETAVGITLPTSTTGMEAWCGDENIAALLGGIWGEYYNVSALKSYGYAILIEPIYPVKLEGQYHSLTVTEIAVYGAAKFGADTVPPDRGDPNSWVWISKYTNKFYPNALRVKSSYLGLSAAGELSSHASFRTIIEQGYGAAIVYGENTEKRTYTVTYYGNGGLWNGQQTWSESATFGSSYVTWDNFFTRKGYTFTGWIDQYGIDWTGDINRPWVWSYNYDVTLYAQWTPNTYTVTYYGNGGLWNSQQTWSESATFGSSYVTWDNFFTRKGYTFTGWIDQYGIDWTGDINRPWVWSYDYDVTLYAQWTPNTYTVTYDGNGGLWNGQQTWSESATFGSSYVTWDNFFTRKGYTFTGWIDQYGIDWTGDINRSWVWSYDYDVTLYAQWTPKPVLQLVAIKPNAAYRETTAVITSFWIVNPTDDEYIPSDNLKVRFSVFNTDNDSIESVEKDIIVPAQDKNLIYFKWNVPKNLNGQDVVIKAVIVDDGDEYGLITKNYSTVPYIYYATPDTEYVKKAPVGFSVPDVPTDIGILQAKWWEYKYENGSFTKVDYGIGTHLSLQSITAPNSVSAQVINNVLTLRSGYGFRCAFRAYPLGIEGYTMPDTGSYTSRQYAYSLFPEFKYEFGTNKCRTMPEENGVFGYSDFSGNLIDHYIPLYFPDGRYNFKIVASDNWTPAGMITTSELGVINISGTLYDDHYIGRR